MLLIIRKQVAKKYVQKSDSSIEPGRIPDKISCHGLENVLILVCFYYQKGRCMLKQIE